MKKLILVLLTTIAVLLIIFFILIAINIYRSTWLDFEKHPACYLTGGAQKMFANGCADHCNSKFEYPDIWGGDIACSSALTLDCECGPSRCWDGEKCIWHFNYKKL